MRKRGLLPLVPALALCAVENGVTGVTSSTPGQVVTFRTTRNRQKKCPAPNSRGGTFPFSLPGEKSGEVNFPRWFPAKARALPLPFPLYHDRASFSLKYCAPRNSR